MTNPGDVVIAEFAHRAELEQLLRGAPVPFEGYIADEKDGGFGIALADDAFASAAKRHVNVLFTGGTYGAAAGPFLFVVGLPVPKDYRDEFLTWYHDEHLPILLEEPGWDGCRFVEEKVEKDLLFHALHQLSDRKALDSDARKRSRSTPWFQRLSQKSWFDKGFARTLYARYS
jgi:hypothetical protein